MRDVCSGDNQGRGIIAHYYGNALFGGYLFTLCDQVSGLGHGFLKGVEIGWPCNPRSITWKQGVWGCHHDPWWILIPQWTDDSVVDVDITNQDRINILQGSDVRYGVRDESHKSTHLKTTIFDFMEPWSTSKPMSLILLWDTILRSQSYGTNYTGKFAPAL